MRFSLVALLILAFAAVAHSQIPGAVSIAPNPDLQIVSAKWQTYYPPVDHSIDFSDSTTTSVGRAMADGRSLMHASGNTVTYPSQAGRERPFSVSSHARLNFIAKLLVKNSSAKTITGFDLDYLFLDASGSEFLRYGFHASIDIKPDKEKQLKQKVHQETGKYRKGYTPLKPTNEQLLNSRYCPTRVIVRRIQYADGSVWERP